jgi:uncharacterized delta-60 repeat protein
MILLSTVLFAATNSIAQSGSLDLTFGNNGIVNTMIGSDSRCNAITIDNNGKILAGGTSKIGTNYVFSLTRYKYTGILDTSFGLNGIITIPLAGGNDVANSITIQSDGKILLAGYSAIGTFSYFSLIRVDSSGNLDTMFGNNGKVITSVGINQDQANSIQIQSDGKILVAGFSSNGLSKDFALVRYNSDGEIDSTFDYDGKVITNFSVYDDIGNSIAIQSDGKILVAGASEFSGNLPKIALTRYNSNGSLDSLFGVNGKATATIGSYANCANSVLIQTDGKIVISGYTNFGLGPLYALIRFNTNGSLDSTFNMNGVVIGGSLYSINNSIAEQLDHKLLVAGWSDTTNLSLQHVFTIYRYNANGIIDSSFGINGKTTTVIGNNSNILSIALQTNGKIVAAGWGLNGSIAQYSLARYNNDSSLCLPFFISDTFTICSGQSITVGNNTYDSTGIYVDIFTSIISGCDSIVTTNLTVLPPINSLQTITICSGQSIIVGNNTYNSTGVYVDIFTSISSGCDSIVTTNLTVLPPINSLQTITICSGQSIIVGNNTYDSTGLYIDTFQSSTLCDSFVTTNLIVNPIPIVSTNNSGTTIISNQPSASYQWIDCNNGYLPILGEINQIFTPASNGNYAVVVTLGLCSDTSSCVSMLNLSTTQFENEYRKIIFKPNPFTSSTTLITEISLKNATLIVYNVYGEKVIFITNIFGNTFILNRENLQTGFYFTELIQDNKIISRNKLIITD